MLTVQRVVVGGIDQRAERDPQTEKLGSPGAALCCAGIFSRSPARAGTQSGSEVSTKGILAVVPIDCQTVKCTLYCKQT